MKKSQLHTACTFHEGFWRSLPPHEPGACFGASGAPCPKTEGRCEHKHATSDAALTCSRNRPSVQDRLAYLRGEIQAERISYGEIAELQSLVDHIDPDDGELLAWAGVEEDADA